MVTTYSNPLYHVTPVTDGPVLPPAPPPAEDPEHERGGEQEAGAEDGGDQRQEQQLARARGCKCVSERVAAICCILVLCTAPSVPQSIFTITEKAPTRAFTWLKAATTSFTFKTLLIRHYAKWMLTPR